MLIFFMFDTADAVFVSNMHIQFLSLLHLTSRLFRCPFKNPLTSPIQR